MPEAYASLRCTGQQRFQRAGQQLPAGIAPLAVRRRDTREALTRLVKDCVEVLELRAVNAPASKWATSCTCCSSSELNARIVGR
ncbi:hypothetical protein ACVXG7_09320 [Enterobacter hormaechei]